MLFYDAIKIMSFSHSAPCRPVNKKNLSTGGNIRLFQMGVALEHLNHVISEVAPGAPLVFCGDFNSSPDSGSSTLVSSASLLARVILRCAFD